MASGLFCCKGEGDPVERIALVVKAGVIPRYALVFVCSPRCWHLLHLHVLPSLPSSLPPSLPISLPTPLPPSLPSHLSFFHPPSFPLPCYRLQDRLIRELNQDHLSMYFQSDEACSALRDRQWCAVVMCGVV